jgi:hypothetical protein
VLVEQIAPPSSLLDHTPQYTRCVITQAFGFALNEVCRFGGHLAGQIGTGWQAVLSVTPEELNRPSLVILSGAKNLS